MKNGIPFLTALVVISMTEFADPYPALLNAYAESYMTTTGGQTVASSAEIRADAHRSMYEVCDRHHICADAGGNSKQTVEQTARKKTLFETVKPFVHASVWM